MTLIILDNNLLSDYLNGTVDAREFLEEHDRDRWGISSIVLFEALMGSLYGYIDATPDEINHAIATSMDVFTTTQRTAIEAHDLQSKLHDRGAPVDQLDALIAASALEHGGRFATAEKQFWMDDVQEVLPVEEYNPH
ncbi:PIN domain-containing protein [Natronolimnohabitans innermongolicus]|uniref:Sugar metabolism cluster protein n=1 Tax=Natronolimnohabitans innermongolicus JCM 12255 TaxID=1227499 RepID=L9WLU5_9EURY|nr:PIN domain-containing protein [Natronolimnohabitans innermongolicus]ELY50191.1 sugar metabolism cluster protein [Natronolimnohabitans innermongolicus JCM 12255]